MAVYRVSRSWWTEDDIEAGSPEEAIEFAKDSIGWVDGIGAFGGDIEFVERIED